MKQPKKPKVSPAKAAANAAFAAAGRASQARKRAAYAKAHHGAKLPPTKAQRQSQLKFAAAGRAAQAARKAGQTPKKKAAATAPDEVLATLPGYTWAMGCNDVAPTCAAAAVANHLLASTGMRMTEEEILHLHKCAGGDSSGGRIGDILELLRGGWYPACGTRIRVGTFFRTDERVIMTGLLVGLSLPHARHVVVSHPQGMISWGRVIPWEGEPDEAWALEWLR